MIQPGQKTHPGEAADEKRWSTIETLVFHALPLCLQLVDSMDILRVVELRAAEETENLYLFFTLSGQAARYK